MVSGFLKKFLAPLTGKGDEVPRIFTEEEKVLYALGHALSEQLDGLELSLEELQLVRLGLQDGALQRRPRVELRDVRPKLEAFCTARLHPERAECVVEEGPRSWSEPAFEAAAEASGPGQAQQLSFIDGEPAPSSQITTPSGLMFREIVEGEGEHPSETSVVKVHYHGTLPDGTVFDSSVERGKPASFPLNQVIPAWTEGLQLMGVGGKALLICPPELAYGDRGAPPAIPPKATLHFEVELLDIVR
jgi:FKBP-type peptidyl-prolyl cis-trans isomerase FkpA